MSSGHTHICAPRHIKVYPHAHKHRAHAGRMAASVGRWTQTPFRNRGINENSSCLGISSHLPPHFLSPLPVYSPTAKGGFPCPKGTIFQSFCPLAALESSRRARDACQLPSKISPVEVCRWAGQNLLCTPPAAWHLLTRPNRHQFNGVRSRFALHRSGAEMYPELQGQHILSCIWHQPQPPSQELRN